jgi:hypothetical protein
MLHDPTKPSGIAGGLAFAGLAASLLVPGLWRGFWVELLAILGALFMLMAPEGLMIGLTLELPALFILVARQWHRFQASLEATP